MLESTTLEEEEGRGEESSKGGLDSSEELAAVEIDVVVGAAICWSVVGEEEGLSRPRILFEFTKKGDGGSKSRIRGTLSSFDGVECVSEMPAEESCTRFEVVVVVAVEDADAFASCAEAAVVAEETVVSEAAVVLVAAAVVVAAAAAVAVIVDVFVVDVDDGSAGANKSVDADVDAEAVTAAWVEV